MTSIRSASSLGFTVVELVLAIAVTGTLVAVIVSAYQTYSVRAQVAVGLELATRWELVVDETYRRSGQVPADWESVGTEPQLGGSSYVGEIALVAGRLDVTFGEDARAAIAGRRLSLTPYETAGREIVWVCGNAAPGLGLKPLGFATGGAQSVQASATVEARYLPSYCR